MVASLFKMGDGGAGDAIDAGVKVAVCSTSSEYAVQTIVDEMLGTDISKVRAALSIALTHSGTILCFRSNSICDHVALPCCWLSTLDRCM